MSLSPSKSASPKGVTLKRTVTIKAIVTEKFKEYMSFEVNQAVTVTQNKIKELDSRMDEVSKVLLQSGASAETYTIKSRIESEKAQLLQSIEEMKKKGQEIQSLPLNGFFVQGMIDGFVIVNPGDNLYEKLGAMEIIVKDGIVQDINAVPQSPVAAA